MEESPYIDAFDKILRYTYNGRYKDTVLNCNHTYFPAYFSKYNMKKLIGVDIDGNFWLNFESLGGFPYIDAIINSDGKIIEKRAYKNYYKEPHLSYIDANGNFYFSYDEEIKEEGLNREYFIK